MSYNFIPGILLITFIFAHKQEKMSEEIRGKIIVVDDEKGMCHILNRVLTDQGYDVKTANSGEEALDILEQESFDAAMLDIRMPGMSGLELLEHIHKDSPDTSVVMMTAFGTIETAVNAMKKGAYEYITKPFNNDEVIHIINNALERKLLIDRNRYLTETLDERNQLSGIIGQSESMKTSFRMVEKVAPTDSTVLLLGESGTGKELFARAIHQHSNRRDEKFMAVNCGALPRDLIESELFGHEKGSFSGAHKRKIGLMESANKGTIFLDEIGDLPLELQVKLLRVLESHEVRRVGSVDPINIDVRVVAATNRDLQEDVQNGTFREDLFFRLSIVDLRIPPLRERKDDIPILVNHFIGRFNEKMNRSVSGLSEEVTRAFVQHHWPGNVRELENVVQRCMVLRESGEILMEDLPSTIKAAQDSFQELDENLKELTFQEAKEVFEKRYLKQLLELNEANVTQSAQVAGISRRHLQELMKKYDLRTKEE